VCTTNIALPLEIVKEKGKWMNCEWARFVTVFPVVKLLLGKETHDPWLGRRLYATFL
jgi:hypothetical protein